ncbi:hypothetical protein AB0L42_42535 [Streptomyces sp. NPDC052287]|uniref:hypothetical protein n=1 Tax=Streptomyces sp. NPDC052287 TaxID=3154950 RepID=UPI003417144C
MRTVIHTALFLLAALEMLAGLLAGSAALVSLTTEAFARSVTAISQGFSRRVGVGPMAPRLRAELPAVLSVTEPEGASR